MKCENCPCPPGLPCIAAAGVHGAWACGMAAGDERARRVVVDRSRLAVDPDAFKSAAPAAAWTAPPPVAMPTLAETEVALSIGYRECFYSTEESACNCGGGVVRCHAKGRVVTIDDCAGCVAGMVRPGGAAAEGADEVATKQATPGPVAGQPWLLQERRLLSWEKAMAAAPRAGTRTPGAAKELVVVRYNEPLDWLADVPADFAITVYDKSPATWELARPGLAVRVPNHGRESSAMLWHLIENYDSLADWTFFVHGDALVHAPDMIRRLGLQYYDITSLTCRYRPGLPADFVRVTDKQLYAGGVELRYGDALVMGHGGMPNWFNPHAWHRLFAAPLPEHVWFCYTAEFVAPRSRLLARPREAYAWLLDCVLKAGDVDVHAPEPLTPWQMEALWLYVLDERFPLRLPPPTSYR
jgi:hypothetical protein